MNEDLAREHWITVDGWPVLVACLMYALAFYILAVTMTSAFAVA